MLSFALGIGTQNTQATGWKSIIRRPAEPRCQPGRSRRQGARCPRRQRRCQFPAGTLRRACRGIQAAGHEAQAELAESLAASQRPLVATFIAEDDAPQSAPEVYLKLHLLSHRLVKPHGTDLTGMFGLLRNIAWTNEGPIDIEELPARRLKARLEGRTLSVDCVDKFPKMTDYVVPSGVRIGDTAGCASAPTSAKAPR